MKGKLAAWETQGTWGVFWGEEGQGIFSLSAKTPVWPLVVFFPALRPERTKVWNSDNHWR